MKLECQASHGHAGGFSDNQTVRHQAGHGIDHYLWLVSRHAGKPALTDTTGAHSLGRSKHNEGRQRSLDVGAYITNRPHYVWRWQLCQ